MRLEDEVSLETIEIETAEGVAEAYLARPQGDGPGEAASRPGVLFLMDAYGLRPAIAGMLERIAGRGHVALAPNLFYRAGHGAVPEKPNLEDPEARGEFMRRLRALMDELTPERIASDGEAYLRRLEAETDGPIVIAGYCMGVRTGWRIVTSHRGRVAALAGFHGGGLVTDAPDSPHRSAEQLDAELYLGFADNDQSMGPEAIGELEGVLDEAGVRYRAEVYEGAGHGYTMADTPVYDEGAAERHFSELFALLERAGNGSPGT
ncbi:MAG: dienelactone hydrolase family protein [Solirubrobacteraceae bacterium]